MYLSNTDEDKQICDSLIWYSRGNNAQNDQNLEQKTTKVHQGSRPGHDIEDLIVFPGCLEGENCHDSNCK